MRRQRVRHDLIAHDTGEGRSPSSMRIDIPGVVDVVGRRVARLEIPLAIDRIHQRFLNLS